MHEQTLLEIESWRDEFLDICKNTLEALELLTTLKKKTPRIFPGINSKLLLHALRAVSIADMTDSHLFECKICGTEQGQQSQTWANISLVGKRLRRGFFLVRKTLTIFWCE